MTKPYTTGTAHELPFDKLSPRDFERLCLWLVKREGFERAEHLGAAGSEQGRDVVAWRGNELWAFQCKRVRRFGPKSALAEVDKVLSLPPDQLPAELVFIATCDVSAKTRQQARKRCAGRFECHFWAGAEFDEKVKQHSDIVDEFFQAKGIPSAPTANQIAGHRLALARMVRYHRWADESFIREQGTLLPLLASSADDETDQSQADLLQIIRAHERLLVLGDPGAGKTVALQRMMWETARRDDSMIPVFVELLSFGGDLFECVRVALNETGKLWFDDPKAVRAFLRRTRCLILLDGLNEVPGGQRGRVVGAIGSFVREFPSNRYVVTCRPRDELWRGLRGGGIIDMTVEIQRITDEQAQEYLTAHLGKERGRELYAKLDPTLRAMARTPLLLWIMKEAGVGGESVPGNRGELYARFVSHILERDTDRRIDADIPERDKRRVLMDLANYLGRTKASSCLLSEAVTVGEGDRRSHSPQNVIEACARHGLLEIRRDLMYAEDIVLFAPHPTVQEHFAALDLCKQAKAERELPKWRATIRRILRRDMAMLARDDWWAETFVQMAGLIDDPSWLAARVASVHPWLALWCIAEGKAVDEETETIVEAKSIASLRARAVRVRRRAAADLSRTANLRATRYLARLLEDEDDDVVNIAIRALSERGEAAVNLLLTILSGGSDHRACLAAIRTLGQIWEWPDLVSLGHQDPEQRAVAARIFGKQGDVRAVEPLIATLGDDDALVRRAATEALGKLRDARAIEPLIAALKDEDAGVRWITAEALGKVAPLTGDVRTVDALITALEDEDWGVRLKAVEVLGKVAPLTGDVRTVDALITALKDEDAGVRLRAAEALGKLRDARTIEPLIVTLRDKDAGVRLRAAEALGKLGDARAVEALTAALGDDVKNVQMWASWALGKTDDSRMVDALITALEDGDAGVRLRAAEALGKLRDARTIEPLIVTLRDEDAGVRLRAAEALGKLRDARAVEPLIAALKDEGWGVRLRAAEALGKLGDARAVEPLIVTLRDEDSDVRWITAEALGKVVPLAGDVRTVDALITALEDEDWGVRKEAAGALGKLGDARAVEPLIAALGDEDWDVRWRTAEALSLLGNAAVELLIVTLRDKDSDVRSGAAEALGDLRDARAVEPLITALEDKFWAVRSNAADALRKITGQDFGEDIARWRKWWGGAATSD